MVLDAPITPTQSLNAVFPCAFHIYNAIVVPQHEGLELFLALEHPVILLKGRNLGS